MILQERIDLTERTGGSPRELENLMIYLANNSRLNVEIKNRELINHQIKQLFDVEYLEHYDEFMPIINSKDSILRIYLLAKDPKKDQFDLSRGLVAVNGICLNQTDFRNYDKVHRIGIAYFDTSLIRRDSHQICRVRRSFLELIRDKY